MPNHSSTTTQPPERLYLCAPINALVEGIFEEKIPFTEIKKHGDFGLGTFDQLAGEMVMLNGAIYQITADGRVTIVDEQACTPFAAVTWFNPLTHDQLDHPATYQEFLHWLGTLLPSPNIFYALRIYGAFSYVKVRSVPKQECYRPLVQVTQSQPTFEFHNVRGTLAGFFTPSFMGAVSVPGLHLHFLSGDLQHGGHLLECAPVQISAGAQFLYAVEIALPSSLEYLTADLQRDIAQDLKRAEK
ncbi:MAG: acetolactate decarboxylase [Chloroflexi bacterium]|nr:acetolactate decarboxylase [Chloroflexota bacterium]